jgi:predicted metal-dependent phosphoesterase TrpH
MVNGERTTKIQKLQLYAISLTLRTIFHEHINASTHRHINASTHQQINASTHQQINNSLLIQGGFLYSAAKLFTLKFCTGNAVGSTRRKAVTSPYARWRGLPETINT